MRAESQIDVLIDDQKLADILKDVLKRYYREDVADDTPRSQLIEDVVIAIYEIEALDQYNETM